MTTLTTVLSMLPMALAIGESAEAMQGMAIVIIGGLTASTVLSAAASADLLPALPGQTPQEQRHRPRGGAEAARERSLPRGAFAVLTRISAYKNARPGLARGGRFASLRPSPRRHIPYVSGIDIRDKSIDGKGLKHPMEDYQGLTGRQAEKLLAEHGENRIPRGQESRYA